MGAEWALAPGAMLRGERGADDVATRDPFLSEERIQLFSSLQPVVGDRVLALILKLTSRRCCCGVREATLLPLSPCHMTYQMTGGGKKKLPVCYL